jgi:uncharacterized protein (UPF0264 family)
VRGDLALSLKQPWAALLVHGRKTIEVRSWRRAVRGRVLIHAARQPDERPEAWAWVTPEVAATAALRGGLVGAARLAEVKVYSSAAAFAADRSLHLNETAWFRPPRLFGLVFRDPVVLPFARCSGQTFFFQVPHQAAAPEANRPQPQLLVSVRSVEEVEGALAGGAALIDVKEPRRGPLGRADDTTITAVVRAVGGRAPVSAALGEWGAPECSSFPSAIGEIAYVKWGLSECRGRPSWQALVRVLRRRLAELHPNVRVVVAAYADWQRAQAVPPEAVCAFACDAGLGAFLVDTWGKDGSTLLDWASLDELRVWRARCAAAGLPMALAGNLGPESITSLLDVAPEWFAVRGAACSGGRDGAIDVDRVRRLAGLLRPGGPSLTSRAGESETTTGGSPVAT